MPDPAVPALPPLALHCSARGCHVEARWALRWNNPQLHPPQRRKTWLACDGHRSRLTDFLSARGFLRETVPAVELPAVDPPAVDPPADDTGAGPGAAGAPA